MKPSIITKIERGVTPGAGHPGGNPSLLERRGKDISNSETLKYPYNWSVISFERKREKNFTCEICQRNLSEYPTLILNVHHLDYNLQNISDENLIVLCRDCHILLHQLEAHERLRLQFYYKALAQGQLTFDLPDELKPTLTQSKIDFLRQVVKEHKT